MKDFAVARQKITTFLWFDNQAEEAANFYVSLFKNSKITQVTRIVEGGPGRTGAAMTVEFTLSGVEFIALNGGPHFKFTEAISLSVDCESQAEIDELWDKLSTGGQKSRCGWLKDKYGLSWQIVPSSISEMMSGKEPAKTRRAMEALMTMTKLDIQKLKAAYEAG